MRAWIGDVRAHQLPKRSRVKRAAATRVAE